MTSPALVVTNHDATVFPAIRDAQARAPPPGRAGARARPARRRPRTARRRARPCASTACSATCPARATARCARRRISGAAGRPPTATACTRCRRARRAPRRAPRRGPRRPRQRSRAAQARITLHAARLLKLDGLMVYSTCAFNPVEDEAVVAEVLPRARGGRPARPAATPPGGPCAQRGPRARAGAARGRRRAGAGGRVGPPAGAAARAGPAHLGRAGQGGLLHVLGRRGGGALPPGPPAHARSPLPCDGRAAAGAQAGATKVVRSMFPPAADAAPPLERCLRVLPHTADTGGFFVAVLRKTRELPAPAAAGCAGAAGRAVCSVAPGGGLPAKRGRREAAALSVCSPGRGPHRLRAWVEAAATRRARRPACSRLRRARAGAGGPRRPRRAPTSPPSACPRPRRRRPTRSRPPRAWRPTRRRAGPARPPPSPLPLARLPARPTSPPLLAGLPARAPSPPLLARPPGRPRGLPAPAGRPAGTTRGRTTRRMQHTSR